MLNKSDRERERDRKIEIKEELNDNKRLFPLPPPNSHVSIIILSIFNPYMIRQMVYFISFHVPIIDESAKLPFIN